MYECGTPLRGRAWTVGDWVSGDDGVIRFSELRDFAGEQDLDELRRMCFAGVIPNFSERVAPGDIVVAGRGFGIPSHPPVPMALRAAGIAAVVVQSTDSAFIRRSLGAGLLVVVCPGIAAVTTDGDTVEIDPEAGRITHLERGIDVTIRPFAPQMLDVLASGGLIPWLKQDLARE